MGNEINRSSTRSNRSAINQQPKPQFKNVSSRVNLSPHGEDFPLRCQRRDCCAANICSVVDVYLAIIEGYVGLGSNGYAKFYVPSAKAIWLYRMSYSPIGSFTWTIGCGDNFQLAGVRHRVCTEWRSGNLDFSSAGYSVFRVNLPPACGVFLRQQRGRRVVEIRRAIHNSAWRNNRRFECGQVDEYRANNNGSRRNHRQ